MLSVCVCVLVTLPEITYHSFFFMFNMSSTRLLLLLIFVALQVKLQESIEYDDLQGDSGRKTITLNLKKSDR